MPWKNFRDPYAIWISEIILQQTRVDQGWDYFTRFIERFPDVHTLARASEDEVLSAWEGLGYYSRARNLYKAAKYISNDLNGIFPDRYEEILKLKGVGPYTAAAIASFAFGLPHGVVDGNVKRVLARVFGIVDPVDTAEVKNYFQEVVDYAVSREDPALFNQAIMNFGAIWCKPRSPLCSRCEIKIMCIAKEDELVERLPVKSSRVQVKKAELNLGLYIRNKSLLLVKRDHSGIWKGLYSFPEIQINENVDAGVAEPSGQFLSSLEWKLSHRDLKINYFRLYTVPVNLKEKGSFTMVKSENLEKFALPRPLRLFLEENSRNLGLKEKHDQ